MKTATLGRSCMRRPFQRYFECGWIGVVFMVKEMPPTRSMRRPVAVIMMSAGMEEEAFSNEEVEVEEKGVSRMMELFVIVLILLGTMEALPVLRAVKKSPLGDTQMRCSQGL